METFLKLNLQSLSLIKSNTFLPYISCSVSEEDCRLFFMKDNSTVVHVGSQSNHSNNSKKLTYKSRKRRGLYLKSSVKEGCAIIREKNGYGAKSEREPFLFCYS